MTGHHSAMAALSTALLLAAPMAVANEHDSACAANLVAARDVQTVDDVKAFVDCAYEFVIENGEEEAYRAFHNYDRWRSGDMYVFVNEAIGSSTLSTVFVHPIRTDVEGGPWGAPLADNFGRDIIEEGVRVLDLADGAFWYYAFVNPSSGLDEPKVSYIRRIDWNGNDAFIGAGVYLRDLPGSCNPTDVNAAALAAAPSNRGLEEFVRCASYLVERLGYFAKPMIESHPLWRSGQIYVFGLDFNGEQFASGGPLNNGRALHEFGSPGRSSEQFGGRDMIGVVETFGEAYFYYNALNPLTGESDRKISFLKRVAAPDQPLIVGAGYYLGLDAAH